MKAAISASIAPTITDPKNIVVNLPNANISSSDVDSVGSVPILLTV